MKTKPLSPTLREQKRYLVYEVISKSKIDDAFSVSNSIQNSLHNFIGDRGLGEAGLIFLNDKFNSDLQRGIVRVEHNHVDTLRASLTLIEKIENKNVILRSVGVSGMINKAVKRYLTIKKIAHIKSNEIKSNDSKSDLIDSKENIVCSA